MRETSLSRVKKDEDEGGKEEGVEGRGSVLAREEGPSRSSQVALRRCCKRNGPFFVVPWGRKERK